MAGKEFDPFKDRNCQGKRCKWFIRFQCFSPDYTGSVIWRRCGGIIDRKRCPILNPNLVHVEPPEQISDIWGRQPVRVLFSQLPYNP